MIVAPIFLGFLLASSIEARSLTEDSNVALVMNGDILEVRSMVKAEGEAEERVGGLVTSLAMSLILDMIKNIITDTILNVLGITTTTTPEPCGAGTGLIGLGLLNPSEETTTAAAEETTTTAAETTTTAAETTTTAAAETTTTAGGET